MASFNKILGQWVIDSFVRGLTTPKMSSICDALFAEIDYLLGDFLGFFLLDVVAGVFDLRHSALQGVAGDIGAGRGVEPRN